MLEGALLLMLALSQGLSLWMGHRAHKDAEKIVAASIARNPAEYVSILSTLEKPKQDKRPRSMPEPPIGL